MKKHSTLILYWATYFVPVLAFEMAFRSYNIKTTDIGASFLLFVFLAIVPTLLFFWLSPKFFHLPLYKIAYSYFYIILYGLACTHIAWGYRAAFGTTWLWTEVFPELVLPQWYFYIFGFWGAFFNDKCQRLLLNKKLT